MNIQHFIKANNIRPADAIVVKKEFFAILNHYVIYLGIDRKGEHKFIANYTDGIKILPVDQILRWLKTFIPVRINRFVGTEEQRELAIQRALSRKDEKAYNLILNNCEHFKNFVQWGKNHSEQVETAGELLLAGGAITTLVGIAKEDETVAGIGLLTLGLGLLAIGLANQD
jgi:hypothetical protein